MTAGLTVEMPIPGVCVLKLSRPEARNALSTGLLKALTAAARDADANDTIRVVVLTGEDPAFCAGLDLQELDGEAANLRALMEDSDADPFAALRSLGKPLLGAVNGPAVTGGLELALSCDFLVASERAWFRDTHASVGIVPGGGMTGLLPQAIGLPRAREMAFTGRKVTAQEAFGIGLVNHVVEHEELQSKALEICGAILETDETTLRALKSAYAVDAQVTLPERLAEEQRRFQAWPIDVNRSAP